MTSSSAVRIGDRLVGPGQPCFVVAEIGINHNGSVETACSLVDAAVAAGCDAVKLQKRTVDVVYSAEELDRPRLSPFGESNRALKTALEFDREAYDRIDHHCRERGILWYASCWDEASVEFLEPYDPPCYKIASASLTDISLLRRNRKTGRPIIASTGMSTMDEIESAVAVLGLDGLVLLHCNSSYPSNVDELNLRVIPTLAERFRCPVGYSGHEVGLQTSVAAVVLGACMVERHITLDRAMWGSDQAASVEPQGFARLVRDIRAVERALGDGTKVLYESELPVRAKLRRGVMSS